MREPPPIPLTPFESDHMIRAARAPRQFAGNLLHIDLVRGRLIAESISLKCEDCDKEAVYIDVTGPNVAAPHCTSCMANELLDLEYDRGRIIAVDEWDEWRTDHSEFRLLT